MYEVNGGILCISDSAVFFTLKKNFSDEELKSFDEKSKKKLGEGSIFISKDKISGLRVASDPKRTTIIEAKGMGDDIGVMTLTKEVQAKIVADIQSLVGSSGEVKVTEPGLFVKSGKHIILSVLAAIMTYLLFYLVTSLNGEEVDLEGKNARKKELLYNIADVLGPTGTIIIGSLITALLIFKAYKNSKISFKINVYKF
ncbi:hypothetical protein [Gynuella sunshinyii]|uniref:Uncharacterized protein n=1 Tax=Gynuella sunshinyii YC6258 TaxID=1445510 RepID=A0A0C5VUY6_9GAMM|nr:hypothetical protein [Gynuella sunshinyii]AJQ94199.1 hypothetical Protein YC6258_02161 [Gynuella sunshinyii YC6258]